MGYIARYIARMEESKKLLEWNPRADKRSRGRSPNVLKKIATNWIATARDRENWGLLEETYIQQWTAG